MSKDNTKEIFNVIQEMEDSFDDDNFIEFFDSEFDKMETIAATRTTAFGWIK